MKKTLALALLLFIAICLLSCTSDDNIDLECLEMVKFTLVDNIIDNVVEFNISHIDIDEYLGVVTVGAYEEDHVAILEFLRLNIENFQESIVQFEPFIYIVPA